MDSILLSILIPVYNASNFLKRCLNSIVYQNEFGNRIEIIIINDGSTDESLKIIHEYTSRFKFIHVISRENKGIGATRNELIENTKGKFFWFIDADDYISDFSSSIIIPLLKTDCYDMLLLSYYWGNEDKGKNIVYSGEFANGFEMAEKEVYNNSLWTRIYRTSIIHKYQIRFHQLKMGEDFDFIFHTIPLLGRIKCIEEPLYKYIANSNSAVFRNDLEHRIQVSEDSLKCISDSLSWINKYKTEEQLILRKPLNAFLMGYIYSLYVVPFDYQYKKKKFHTLFAIGALPIKPYPSSCNHKLRALIVNNSMIRKISLWCDTAILKLMQ